jgi:hypothetical protein
LSTQRPLGATPRSQTPQTPTNTYNNNERQTSQSNVPPEMRTVQGTSLQSNVPPEMRTVQTSPIAAEPAQQVQNLEPPEQEKPNPSRRRRSSITSRLANLVFAGDAQVSTMVEDLEDENLFRKEVWAVVCCIIVLIGVAVGVGVAVASPECDDCVISTPSPTDASIAESPRLVLLREALMHLSTDPSVLQDPATPQYDALVWMADEDEAAIDLEDTNRLEVRYALAALYFATNGDNWFRNLGFLSPTHECDWFVELDQGENSTTTVAAGVSCNDEDEVLAIKLGRL